MGTLSRHDTYFEEVLDNNSAVSLEAGSFSAQGPDSNGIAMWLVTSGFFRDYLSVFQEWNHELARTVTH